MNIQCCVCVRVREYTCDDPQTIINKYRISSRERSGGDNNDSGDVQWLHCEIRRYCGWVVLVHLNAFAVTLHLARNFCRSGKVFSKHSVHVWVRVSVCVCCCLLLTTITPRAAANLTIIFALKASKVLIPFTYSAAQSIYLSSYPYKSVSPTRHIIVKGEGISWLPFSHSIIASLPCLPVPFTTIRNCCRSWKVLPTNFCAQYILFCAMDKRYMRACVCLHRMREQVKNEHVKSCLYVCANGIRFLRARVMCVVYRSTVTIML